MASFASRKILSPLFFCFWLTGCAMQHKLYLYPICFYQYAPQQQRVQGFYSPLFVAGLQSIFKDSGQAQMAVSPDGRWLLASLTKAQNGKLTKIWPRIGCIGNALDSQGTKEESDCVSYVAAFVADRNYIKFGNAKDAGGFDIWNESPVPDTLVHCHQIKEDEQR